MIVNLRERGEIDAQTILTGPLRCVRLLQLRPGEFETLVADTQEHTVFTVDGSGSAVTGSATVPLQHGMAVTVPLGGMVTVEAGPEGLELFVVSLAVSEAEGGSK
jgi:mannose-6-phosphate isomerase-like protein (cupin superfamily)